MPRISKRQLTAFPELRRSRGMTTAEELKQLIYSKPPQADLYRANYGRSVSMDRIEQALRSAQGGYMRDLTDLARETAGLDPHLTAVLNKRINAVAAAPWEITPAAGPGVNIEKAKLYADIAREQLERVDRFQQAIRQLAWGLFDGRSALENHWVTRAPDERGVVWHLAALAWVHPRRLQFGPERELRLCDDVYLGGQFAPIGVALRDQWPKFVEFKPQLFGEYPEREGLAPRCLYWSFFKRFSARDRMILLELFGKPWRIVKVMPESDADAQALTDAADIADRLGHSTSARMPRGVDLDVVQPGQGAGEVHAEVIAESDRQISKLVLGQTGTTDAVSNGLGAGQQSTIMQDEQLLIFTGDCDLISDAIEDGITDAIIALNYGPDELINAPRFRLRAEIPTDRKAEAERVKVALDAGLELSLEEVYSVVGFKHPSDDEAKLVMSSDGFTRAPTIIPGKAEAQEFGDALDRLEQAGPGPVQQPPKVPVSDAAREATSTVNEIRAVDGKGPLMLPDGSQDPDGFLTVDEFKAKKAAKAGVIGTAEGKAEAPVVAPAPEPAAAPADPAAAPEDPSASPAEPAAAPAEPPRPPAKPANDPLQPRIAQGPLAASRMYLTLEQHAEEVGNNALRVAAEQERLLIDAMRGRAVEWTACHHSASLEKKRQPETTYGSLEEIIDRGVLEASRVADRWTQVFSSAVEGKSDARSIHKAIKLAAEKLDLFPFARSIERRLVQGTMTGALDSQFEADAEEAIEPEAFTAPSAAASRAMLADPPADPPKPQPKFTRMPYKDALKFFKAKQPIPKSLFEKLNAAAKARSFTVAGLASEHALSTVQSELARAIGEGRDLRSFAKDVQARLKSAGFSKLNASHLETVFRTNILDSYSVGRRAEMAQPERVRLRPFWKIYTVKDARQRDTHGAVHGWVLRADDPFWRDVGGPPWGFNCRCRVTSLSPRRAKGVTIRSGVEMSGLPDDGFEPNALFPPGLVDEVSASREGPSTADDVSPEEIDELWAKSTGRRLLESAKERARKGVTE